MIAVYLLPDGEPTLVDCGPSTCLDTLRAALAAHGLALADLRHLLLTHIHLDHAGAAGRLVGANPRLTVWVSEVGAPHLVDPSRLERSARRLYGEEFDRLWGELVPTPKERIRVAHGKAAGLDALVTPGHASHQLAYFDREGSCYPGDTTGIRIVPSSFVVPATPPPDVDLEGWSESLRAIGSRQPRRLCLTHFGTVEQPQEHLAQMRERLLSWAERVRAGATEEEFVRLAEQELRAGSAEAQPTYADAQDFRQSYLGLRRYWDKRAEREAS